ncbi:hypothetical protein H6F51_25485 [Cyanobacteria bacterium FACHB-DQ100]|uniref:hypothetical protein n=1 Tax=unclassified Leptolyngbya TaxID=2650499 RepID=UPI001681A5D4|nr:hypothetical protein [Leptolyngbya sp. FACHB-17]MBD1825828.1 hypothetical protein [Cyanobacteria bacterium FACHB-DQ100]MBD2078515.1 hypothetical protein [Leptolyngbya sp. FACHB-17]
MIHGLLWLPLLAAFIGLAYAGWNEYQTLETYRRWAEPFGRAKYDIYSVLGQKEDTLTVGKATRKAVTETDTFSLESVQNIRLLVNGEAVDLNAPPTKGKTIALAFDLGDQSIEVPFTQVSLAARWGEVLTKDWQALK